TAQKAQPKHLQSVRRCHAIELFIDRTHQDLPPEAFHGARRLAMLFEPLSHADVIEIGALLPSNRVHPASNSDLLRKIQEMEIQERTREMGRCGKHPSAQHTTTPVRFDEVELAMKTNVAFDAQTSIKIQQIHAALQQNVLAVVDGLRAGLI